MDIITIEVSVSKDALRRAMAHFDVQDLLDVIKAMDTAEASTDFLVGLYHWARKELYEEGQLDVVECDCLRCRLDHA